MLLDNYMYYFKSNIHLKHLQKYHLLSVPYIIFFDYSLLHLISIIAKTARATF
jgi:hypothetical protein